MNWSEHRTGVVRSNIVVNINALGDDFSQQFAPDRIGTQPEFIFEDSVHTLRYGIDVRVVTSAYGQMDERFYFPDKEWIGIEESIEYKKIALYDQQDTIHSLLLRPNTEQIKATILYFHGNRGSISKWVNVVKPLLNSGFQVCMMDYRGYGKSTGTPTHINIAHDAQLFHLSLLTSTLAPTTHAPRLPARAALPRFDSPACLPLWKSRVITQNRLLSIS